MPYHRPAAGEWVQPVREGYKFACCDCDLVHRMDFRVEGGRPQFRAFRDERSTAALRRERRKRSTKRGAAAMPVVRCKQKHAHNSMVAALACDKNRALIVYTVWAGDGRGTYDASASYDELDEMLGDVRAAVANGRHVLIEPGATTRKAYEAEGEPFPPSHNPLLKANQ